MFVIAKLGYLVQLCFFPSVGTFSSLGLVIEKADSWGQLGVRFCWLHVRGRVDSRFARAGGNDKPWQLVAKKGSKHSVKMMNGQSVVKFMGWSS